MEGMLSGISVGIVAPSGYPVDESAPARAAERLKALGCRVRNFHDPAQKYQRFAAADAARAAQLHAAAADSEVQVVMALRGGYGMTRLLPQLDLRMLAASGKLFVGHSDFTALQMALLAHGAASFAGPMICDDFSRPDPSEFTLRQFAACLTGERHAIRFEAADNPALDVSGRLWGGNLAMLAHLAGTPYLPRIAGGILFIEDINEHPYRVERMLLQLWHAGLLENQRAILLGDFSGYRLGDYDNGYGFEAMLAYLRETLPAPVLTGLPFGHIRDKATLAVGGEARLQSDGSLATLTMGGYPHLARA